MTLTTNFMTEEENTMDREEYHERRHYSHGLHPMSDAPASSRLFSIGSFVQAAVVVFTVGLTWGVFSVRADNAEDDLQKLEVKQEILEKEVSELEGDVKAIRVNSDNQGNQLTRMEALLQSMIRSSVTEQR